MRLCLFRVFVRNRAGLDDEMAVALLRLDDWLVGMGRASVTSV